MDRFHVPGVASRVIQDFKIHGRKDTASPTSRRRTRVDTDTLSSGRVHQQAGRPRWQRMRAVQDGRFGLDDDINTLLKSWKLPDSEFTRGHPVTPRR